MRQLALFLAVVVLAACRGESPPRDYQNAPPAMTHPPQSKTESPAEKGMPQPPPETSTGIDTKTATDTTTIKDQAPATKTHT